VLVLLPLAVVVVVAAVVRVATRPDHDRKDAVRPSSCLHNHEQRGLSSH